jgi:hypothetical protein
MFHRSDSSTLIVLPAAIYIVLRLSVHLVTEDCRALAEFRYQIRRFLALSEAVARSGKLQAQQYMLLLALRGLPAGKEPTILVLSERLQIRHHSLSNWQTVSPSAA